MYQLNQIDRVLFEQYFCTVPQSNLLQSWHYGDAKAAVENWTAERFLITKMDEPIAILQVLKKSFFGVWTIVRINRGPLWLKKENAAHDAFGVYQLLKNTYTWYRRQILFISPNLDKALHSKNILKKLRYRASKPTASGSIWLNLNQPEINLLKQLRGNWRNQLRMAQKKGVELEEIKLTSSIDWFLTQYVSFQHQSNFTGASANLIRYLLLNAKLQTPFQGYILVARHQSIPIGAILIVTHGLAATYLASWRDKELGKGLHGANFLLWHALLMLKARGYHYLDLGGIKMEADDSVTSFKRGLQGEEYWLEGEYIAF